MMLSSRFLCAILNLPIVFLPISAPFIGSQSHAAEAKSHVCWFSHGSRASLWVMKWRKIDIYGEFIGQNCFV